MKYHSLKMEEVNDTMKHLWNKTYQGTGMYRIPRSGRLRLTSFQISTVSRSGLTWRAALQNDRITTE